MRVTTFSKQTNLPWGPQIYDTNICYNILQFLQYKWSIGHWLHQYDKIMHPQLSQKSPFWQLTWKKKQKKQQKKNRFVGGLGHIFPLHQQSQYPLEWRHKEKQKIYTTKLLKFGTPRTIAVLISYNKNVSENVHGIINSEDPEQTASLGALWSRSVLFAYACLTENIGSLR